MKNLLSNSKINSVVQLLILIIDLVYVHCTRMIMTLKSDFKFKIWTNPFQILRVKAMTKPESLNPAISMGSNALRLLKISSFSKRTRQARQLFKTCFYGKILNSDSTRTRWLLTRISVLFFHFYRVAH